MAAWYTYSNKDNLRITLTLFFLLQSFTGYSANSANSPQPSCYSHATALLKGYIVHIALAWAHELGHVLFAKAALAAGASIVADNNNPRTPSITFTSPFSLTAYYPEFNNQLLNAANNALGPVCGLLAVYCLLKGESIVREYQKNQNIQQAIHGGWQKPLFHEEQSESVQTMAAFHGLCNGIHLVPFKLNSWESHGYTMWQSLRK